MHAFNSIGYAKLMGFSNIYLLAIDVWYVVSDLTLNSRSRKSRK